MRRKTTQIASCCGRFADRPGVETAGWVVPAVTLLFLPKCPACVAGYLALVTGFGVSMTAAGYLRTLIVVAAVATLIVLGLRRLLRRFAKLGANP